MKTKIVVSLVLSAALGGSLFAQNNARMLSTPNSQTGTSYAFVAADTTRVVTFNNVGAVAASLPSGATFGFGAGTMLSVVNLGAGTVTITCSSCTITANGTASATLGLAMGQGADIYGGYGSSGVNYVALPSPSAANAALLNANNNFTGTQSVTNAGVFTNTQITNAISSFVNGVPFPYAGTGFMTAVAGGVTTPSSATAINIDGIYGTAISNCNSVGRTICNTDGGYFSAQANANGAGVWGINPIALDVAGVANAHITGIETDIGVGGTPAFVRGQTIILTDGGGTVGTMPASGNSIGLEILGTHTPTQQWNRGIQVDDGASSLHALQIGAVNNGTSQGGQLIGFARWDSGGVRRTTETININSVGDLLFTQTGGASTLLHGMGTGNLLTTGSGAGNLLQTKRTAGCTTSGGATPFTGPCTVTVTWPNTFADGNYTVTCTGNGIGAGIPLLQASTTITGASTIVQTQQATGVNASFNNIECIAIHD